MDNSKFLKTVIVVLLIINIGTLAFMWKKMPGHGMPPPPQEIGRYLMHELKFTDEQVKQYEQLREEHRNSIDHLRRQSRNLHDAFFDLLSASPVDSSKVNELADSIVSLQKQIEISTYYHFQKVRTLCTPEQQQQFDKVIKDALAMMAPRPPGR